MQKAVKIRNGIHHSGLSEAGVSPFRLKNSAKCSKSTGAAKVSLQYTRFLLEQRTGGLEGTPSGFIGPCRNDLRRGGVIL